MWSRKGGFGGTTHRPRVAITDKGMVIRPQEASSSNWLDNDTISMGYSDDEWGVVGKDGANKVFELGSTNKIAGFTFTNTKLSTTGFEIGDNSEDYALSSSGFQVDHEGNLTGSNVQVSGGLTASAGLIGGFTLTTE